MLVEKAENKVAHKNSSTQFLFIMDLVYNISASFQSSDYTQNKKLFLT